MGYAQKQAVNKSYNYLKLLCECTCLQKNLLWIIKKQTRRYLNSEVENVQIQITKLCLVETYDAIS